MHYEADGKVTNNNILLFPAKLCHEIENNQALGHIYVP